MPREADAEPTAENIRELHAHNTVFWSPQRPHDAQMRSLTENTHTVWVPDTMDKRRKNRQEPEKMTTAVGGHAVQVVKALYATPATIGVMQTGETAESTTAAESVELALAEARDQLNPVTDSPRSRELSHMLVTGRRARLTLPGHVAWFDTPKFRKGPGNERETSLQFMTRRRQWRRKAPIPILAQDLPPETTFPPSFGRVDDEVLSTTISSWNELLDQFTVEELGDELPPPNLRHETITLAIYANRVWVAWAVLAEKKTGKVAGVLGGQFPDKIIRAFEHGMGRCPIRIAAGLTGPWKEPGLYWRGILYLVKDMIAQVDTRFSEAATGSKFNALPWLKYFRNRRSTDETPSQAAARITEQLSLDVAVLDNGDENQRREDIEPLHLPQYGEKTLALATFQLDLIRRITGATDAIEGLPGPAASTAWERNYTAELAKGFFKELTLSVSGADIDDAEQVMRATVAFGEDIVLQPHSEAADGPLVLRPEDVKKFDAVLKSEYRLQLPQNRRADVEQGISIMERVKAAELPIDLFWIEEEFLGIDQPEQMFKQAVKSRFITSPRMWEWQESKLLEEADVRMADMEGISVDQFNQQFADRVTPGMAQLIRGKADPTGELQGRNVAARMPTTAASGGPQPQEQA